MDGDTKEEDEEVLFVESNVLSRESHQIEASSINANASVADTNVTATNGGETADRLPSGNTANTDGENAGPSNDTEHNLPKLDPVQLASVLKDFDGRTDPLFEGVPDYMAVIVKEMLETDFLLVLGRGLGVSQIMRLFLAKVKQASPNALVLILGRREADDVDNAATNVTASNSTGETGDESMIGFGVSADKRSMLYKKGGIYHITAPIAVVDILTGVLDASTVSGLLIAHGENVSENSTAAFLIRLLREYNKTAFIKALCDTPEQLLLPPALPMKLRILGVKTIVLWPRFHLTVDRSLPRLEVDEIIVEQSPAVRKQQALLTELMQAVLSDVKRRVPHLDVDFLAPALGPQQVHESPEQLHALTTADAFLAAPDLPWRIRNALQGSWHQLSRDGKRSVQSLGTLQQLQHTLIEFDALSFWSQLDFACRDSSEPWVALPAADTLVAEARREAALKRVPGKFHHVKDLIKTFLVGSEVLIICDSPKTIFELHAYLSQADETTVEDEQMLRAMEESMRKVDEQRAKARAAEHAAKINEGRPGRRRVRGGKASSPGRSSAENNHQDTKNVANVDSEVLKTEDNMTPSPSPVVSEASRSAQEPPAHLKRKYETIDSDPSTQDDRQLEELEMSFPDTSVHITFGSYRGYKPLHALKPDHIIMYDPNLEFTREVERYVATIPPSQARPTIHFMYYQKSVEELQYLTAMRREKDAFTKLIREKGLMPMVLRDGESTREGDDKDDIRLVGSSRRNYQVSQTRQRVVVDTREFRSALPFLIWQSRMDVVPVTLLVGDYVLTPEIVVERKSISDLIGSFRDGRLYAQCESMQRHYKIAVLLIEFDNLSHFSMEPFKDVRSRQSADVQREIQGNVTALLLRFPKLKLIWSASPLHSAQIFRGLKEMEPEPEPEECTKAGQSVLYDSVALSMLEALPGITPGNSFLLAKIASTFEEICELSRQQIIDALGPENGDKLHRFLTMRRQSEMTL